MQSPKHQLLSTDSLVHRTTSPGINMHYWVQQCMHFFLSQQISLCVTQNKIATVICKKKKSEGVCHRLTCPTDLYTGPLILWALETFHTLMHQFSSHKTPLSWPNAKQYQRQVNVTVDWWLLHCGMLLRVRLSCSCSTCHRADRKGKAIQSTSSSV